MFRNNFHPTSKVVQQGFLISVETEEGVSIDALKNHLADACTWIEGVGRTEVDYMGEIEQVEDES